VDEEPVVSQLFKKSRLQGKQIWYITAPSSIPISTIQNLSLEKVRSHSKAFISEDKDYAFFEDASQDKSRMKLVLPKASAEGYQLSMSFLAFIYGLGPNNYSKAQRQSTK